MKSKYSIIRMLMVTILSTTIIISGCTDEPTVTEKVEALLISGEWKNSIVTVDGVDQSSLYQGFTIKFTSTNYNTSVGSPLWTTFGTWKFKDESAKALILDGVKEISINEITETKLELAVQNDNTTFKSGRTSSIKGKNIFRLSK